MISTQQQLNCRTRRSRLARAVTTIGTYFELGFPPFATHGWWWFFLLFFEKKSYDSYAVLLLRTTLELLANFGVIF